MKRILFILVTVAVTSGLYAQNKGFVYKPAPSKYVAAEKLDVTNVCVIVKDSRVLHPKTKVNCTIDDIQSAIIQSLNTAFPDSKFNSNKSNVTIEVKIKQYESFARGVVWIGITEYEVKYNNGGVEERTIINGTHSEGNVGGKSTSKKVLSKSFDKANLSLIEWILSST